MARIENKLDLMDLMSIHDSIVLRLAKKLDKPTDHRLHRFYPRQMRVVSRLAVVIDQLDPQD